MQLEWNEEILGFEYKGKKIKVPKMDWTKIILDKDSIVTDDYLELIKILYAQGYEGKTGVNETIITEGNKEIGNVKSIDRKFENSSETGYFHVFNKKISH